MPKHLGSSPGPVAGDESEIDEGVVDAHLSPAGRQIATARRLLGSAKRVVVLTGAGISTDSGIPDFRGPSGVWTKNPEAERQARIDVYMSDPDVRRRSWRHRIESPTWDAEPNEGHRALVALERRGVLDLLVTQNVDGLHQAAGSDPGRVVEIHGTMREVACMRCGARSPMGEVLERVEAGEEDPSCLEPDRDREVCGGILKAATISFGQNLVASDRERAERAASACDLMLAVGSTLSVYPAAGLVPIAWRAGAAVVIVNEEETEYDSIAEVVINGSISEVLPAILGSS
ncbi:MAG TPA: Sir2 family NAD-dependent protein deacetylase [Acidimicrobiales bacterium]|nr:Sir2 family NAD-dependent protein deacetylase [Acidimicrobiales bacterium]